MPFYAPAFVLYLTTLCYDIYHFLHIASSISCLEKTSTHGSNEIESLSFNIEDPQILLQVHTDLASLKKKCAKEVNMKDGLIVRPKVPTKSMVELTK